MTREILLSKGQVAIVDEVDFIGLSEFKWHASKRREGLFYAYRTSTRRSSGVRQTRHFAMHRVVLQAPKGMVVDHINGNGLDNRRVNLRLATKAQNGLNHILPARARSGFRGVSAARDRFAARLWTGNRLLHLGVFDTAEEAALAWDLAALDRYGEFASLNFPD